MPSTTYIRSAALAAAIAVIAACEPLPAPAPAPVPVAAPAPAPAPVPPPQPPSEIEILAAGGIEDTAAPEPVDAAPVLTPGRQAALSVAEDLRGSIGSDSAGGLSQVTVIGQTVVARVDVPVEGADLTDDQRSNVSDAIRGAFLERVCQRSGFDELFSNGGALQVTAVGSDASPLATTTVRSCG